MNEFANCSSCRYVALLVLGLTVSCATGGPPVESTADARQQSGADLAAEASEQDMAPMLELLSREAEAAERHPLDAAGIWQATIESTQPPQLELVAGVTSVRATIGPAHDAMLCLVRDGYMDPGQALLRALRSVTGQATFVSVALTDVAHDGLVPLLTVRGLYQKGVGARAQLGDFKAFAASYPEHFVACMQDAPGFRQSFSRVAADFARSLRFARKGKVSAPSSGFLYGMELDGIPIGFTEEQHFKGPKGTQRESSQTFVMPPGKSNDLFIRTSTEEVTLDRKGEVVHGRYLLVEDGVVAMDVRIDRKRSKYNFSGSKAGEPVEGSFAAAMTLRGQGWFQSRLRKVARAGRPVSFSTGCFAPEDSLEGLCKSDYAVEPVVGGLVIKTNDDDALITMHADKDGIVTQMTTLVDGIEVVLPLLVRLPAGDN